jgi:hypothetical protein
MTAPKAQRSPGVRCGDRRAGGDEPAITQLNSLRTRVAKLEDKSPVVDEETKAYLAAMEATLLKQINDGNEQVLIRLETIASANGDLGRRVTGLEKGSRQ